MRSMFKNKKDNNRLSSGFTLMELIIVMAIIGILAAIAVPSMVAYITQSRLDSANSSAKTVYNAMNNYCMQCINAGIKIPSATYPASGTFIEIGGLPEDGNRTPDVPLVSMSAASAESYITQAIAINAGSDFEGTFFSVQINSNGFPAAVIWAQNDGDRYVGGYPNPADRANWTIAQAQ